MIGDRVAMKTPVLTTFRSPNMPRRIKQVSWSPARGPRFCPLISVTSNSHIHPDHLPYRHIGLSQSGLRPCWLLPDLPTKPKLLSLACRALPGWALPSCATIQLTCPDLSLDAHSSRMPSAWPSQLHVLGAHLLFPIPNAGMRIPREL